MDGENHCGVKSHEQAKFTCTLESYYIRMAGDSALCYPFVALAELSSFNRMEITRESHASRDWVEILYEFLSANNIGERDEDVKPLAVLGGGATGGGRHVDVFFSEDQDDQVSNLQDPAEQQSDAPESRLALSRSAWRSFRPLLVQTEIGARHESESWYKYVANLQETAASVVSSMSDVLEVIPESLHALDSKVEQFFVTKTQMEDDYLTPLMESQEQLLWACYMEMLVRLIKAHSFRSLDQS